MLVIKKERQGKNIERKLLLKSVTVISSETPMEMWVSMSVSAKTATSPSLGDDSILKAMKANCHSQSTWIDREIWLCYHLRFWLRVCHFKVDGQGLSSLHWLLRREKQKTKQAQGRGERGEGYPQDMMVFSKLCFNDYQFSFMDTKHWFPFSF